MNETVTVHYRFHPLAGTRATTLENRSHRGEPIVVVTDSDRQRYHLPLWMTAPEAAQWGLRDRPRLSHSALSELRGLIAVWSAQPAPPATGDRDEISKARETAEDADVRAAAPGQPAGGCETGGGGRSGGADCGGDGRHRSGLETIRARAELHDARIHDIRHSFASRALALGEGLPIIGRLLGHRRVETTAPYAHLARDSIRESAERIAVSIAAEAAR